MVYSGANIRGIWMRENKEKIIAYIYGIYCAALLIQNISATKTFDLWVFTLTTGILVSPIVFIIQDVSCEILGFAKTKEMILLSFALNFVAVIIFQIAICIPSSAGSADAFKELLSSTPRIAIASFAAYVSGSLLNSKIMVIMREKWEKKFFTRAITSTFFGQACDNAIFAVVAFYGVLDDAAIISMIIGGTLCETVYEIAFFPATKTITKMLKRRGLNDSKKKE